MCTYITPVHLNKFDTNTPDLCYKCSKHQGILYHCLWMSVLKHISQMTISPVPLCPMLRSLGQITLFYLIKKEKWLTYAYVRLDFFYFSDPELVPLNVV